MQRVNAKKRHCYLMIDFYFTLSYGLTLTTYLKGLSSIHVW